MRKSLKVILSSSAVLVLLLVVGFAGAVVQAQLVQPSQTEAQSRLVVYPSAEPEGVIFDWRGPATAEMPGLIAKAFTDWKSRAKTVSFALDSRGGDIAYADPVIAVFNEIKKTHRFDTVVFPGEHCESLCVVLFLQGQRRTASHASLWLFHEAARYDEKGRVVELSPERTEKIFDKYFKPANVPETWLASLRMQIRGKDYWTTGDDLFKSGSNIITDLRGSSLSRS